MTPEKKRSRFIPFRKTDLIEMLMKDERLSEEEKTRFREFGKILEAVFHFEFHRKLETLKDCFEPFNPDSDTRKPLEISEDEKKEKQARLGTELAALLESANYEKIHDEDLNRALEEESLFKVRLEVNFDDFDDIVFFRRGETVKKETLVKFGGLKKKEISFANYDRVVIYVKFKDQEFFDRKGCKNLNFAPGSTLIKLFQNVPKADLEMLFPNSEVRMKTIDKIVIGVPAAVSGVVVVATKLGASLVLIGSVLAFWLGLTDRNVEINQQHLIGLGAGLAALGGFLVRQIGKFKNRKIQFMKALADNLYFKNLDNNAGVFFHLIDAAEEEEFKEAMLAFFFLTVENRKMTRVQLDRCVEDWFAEKWDCQLDFEIDDALKKLERLELAIRNADTIRAVPLEEAKTRMDVIWDNYFEYNTVKE